ncbi:MAG: hypothetical protein WBA88_16395, partial [Pseudaminobacter sp.]
MVCPARVRAAALVVAVVAASWAPASAQPKADAAKGAARLKVCHGFGCHFQSQLDLGSADARRFAALLAAGRGSPRAERAAVS